MWFLIWQHLKQRPECDPAQKLSLREAASTNHDSCRFFALCLPLLALGILPNAHCSCPGCFALLICAGSLRICAIVGLLGNVCFLWTPGCPCNHATVAILRLPVCVLVFFFVRSFQTYTLEYGRLGTCWCQVILVRQSRGGVCLSICVVKHETHTIARASARVSDDPLMMEGCWARRSQHHLYK